QRAVELLVPGLSFRKFPMTTRVIASLFLVGASSCSRNASAFSREHASEGAELRTSKQAVRRTLEATPSPTQLHFRTLGLFSPLTAEVLDHLHDVAARAPDFHDDRVAKMGGSSVVSRAFLHCFESDEVNLDGREQLRETLDRFRRASSGVTSFARESL